MVLGRFPSQYAFIWLLQVGAIVIIWNFLPSSASRVLIVSLVASSSLLLIRHQKEMAIMTSVGLLTALALLWLSNGFIAPVTGAAVVFTGIVLTGLLIGVKTDTTEPSDSLPFWIILGFAMAQISSIAAIWPANFFQRTVLSLVFFYFLWHLGIYLYNPVKNWLMNHFIYSLVAVIVVIGSIIAGSK